MNCCNPLGTGGAPPAPFPTPSAFSGGAPLAWPTDDGEAIGAPMLPNALPSFAAFFQSQEDDTTFTTGSASLVTALTLTTIAIPAGLYRVSWYGETTQTATALSSVCACLINGVTAGSSRHGDEVDILDVFPRAGWRVLALAAGVQTILLQVSTTAPSMSIIRRRLSIERVG